MKLLLTILISGLFMTTATSQVTESKNNKPDPAKKIQLVDVSCGKCKLGLPGKTCEMAVRVGENAYYADGADIDDFGDAHDHDGLCNAIRKAEVQGELVDGRFKLTYIKILSAAPKIKH